MAEYFLAMDTHGRHGQVLFVRYATLPPGTADYRHAPFQVILSQKTDNARDTCLLVPVIRITVLILFSFLSTKIILDRINRIYWIFSQFQEKLLKQKHLPLLA